MSKMTITASMVVAVATLISSIASLVKSFRTSRQIKVVHQAINGRVDELVAASHAQGRQDERDEVGCQKAPNGKCPGV